MLVTSAIFSCVVGKEVAVDARAGLRCAAVACSLLTAVAEEEEDEEGAILAVDESRKGDVLLLRLTAWIDERAALAERSRRIIAVSTTKYRGRAHCRQWAQRTAQV